MMLYVLCLPISYMTPRLHHTAESQDVSFLILAGLEALPETFGQLAALQRALALNYDKLCIITHGHIPHRPISCILETIS